MRRAHLLIAGAWLVHAAAWLLPVIKDGVTLPEGVPGWQAFRVALSAVWPYESFEYDTWYHAFLGTLSAVTTIFFLMGSPWVVVRQSRRLRRAAAWAAAAAFVLNAHWVFILGRDWRDLRIGYFLWWWSFLWLAIGLFDLAGPGRDAGPSPSHGA